MVALSWACLATRVVLSACKAGRLGSTGDRCGLWVFATSCLVEWYLEVENVSRVCNPHRDEHLSIGGSHKCGAGEMHPREGKMMELNLPEGWQRLAGLDGSALCIKVAIERSASGRRMSTLKFSSLVSQRY